MLALMVTMRRRSRRGIAVKRSVRRNPEGRKLYEYASTLRPVSFATVPEGIVSFRRDAAWPHGVVQYAKPLSRADVEHFSLVPLDPADPINVKKRYAAFKERVYLEFAEHDIVVMPTRYGKMSLTYSTRPGVEFQLTRWSHDETPVGHMDLGGFDEAVRAMWMAATDSG